MLNTDTMAQGLSEAMAGMFKAGMMVKEVAMATRVALGMEGFWANIKTG